ncbi:PASTA domain-containing protein [Kineosporia babensis]|uniref:PASTA domain-containing protein n=1 Tax=Kineosporia babensis TaxID=499548 RepID=A0A9X1N9A9_9ACTN|nr:PASTA domain-containing protein [Kineosporia babensis]MCD5309644.1 PASTA domain-containing protein [Kineosporia babensis]
MKVVRSMLAVVGVGALGLLLAGCGGGGAQVGSIGAEENPPAEAAPASTQSREEIEQDRAEDRENDPRTADEERREEAREAADKVKEVADDIRRGVTEPHFTMPDLIGQNLQDAQDELQDRGSYLLDQVDATSQNRFQLMDTNWKVCAQAPKAGKQVLKTKLVRLESVKIEENCP